MVDMKYLKLRTAWSVGWGVICVLLVALWVRSYWRYNAIFLSRPNFVVQVRSLQGRLSVLVKPTTNSDKKSWLVANRPPLGDSEHLWPGLGESLAPQYSFAGFAIYRSPMLDIFAGPYWLFVFVGGLATTLPWLRFSLRTLLIVATVFAIGLGLFVMMLRGR
jgi:hypothetical protein